MRLLRLTTILIAFVLAACGTNPPGPTATPARPTFDLDQIVHATIEALTAQATPPASATPVPATATLSSAPGSISGALSYPADAMPALYVVAYQVGTQTYQYVITQPGQMSYEIGGLPPGTWHIVAYTVGSGSFPPGLSGGYTKAVACGLAQECADHALVDVVVAPGQHVTGITPSDWFAPPGTYPPFAGAPGLTATAAVVSTTPLPTLPQPAVTATATP